ncbi:hypothetical protein [Salinicoccus sp. CNSTN-B1]
MLKSIIFKWSMYISSYVPLFILIYLKQAELHDISLLSVWSLNICFWTICITLSVLGLIIFFNWLWGKPNTTREYSNIKPINTEVLNYFITYLIPLLSLDVTNIYSIILNAILFFIIGLIHVRSNLYHLNTLLIILGYSIYQSDDDYILISKVPLTEDYIHLNIKSNGVSPFNIVHGNYDENK